jgi:hypothetical protein
MIGKSSLLNMAALAMALSAGSVTALPSDNRGLASAPRVRQAKSRGGRFQRQRYGNPPGKYAPHQGKKEMARRVRNIALGRYNKEQLA